MTKIATIGRRVLKGDVWHDDRGPIPGYPDQWDPAMTEAEQHEAALSDPDCPPVPADAPARRVSAVKRLRWKLNLSLEDFAQRYRIPAETVHAWERHEAEPDAAARAYLLVIEREPEAVERALATAAA